MGIAYALLAMLCFATNILITRVALTRMPVDAGFLVVLAMNIAFPGALFGLELAARAAPFEWQWKAAGLFALSGLVGTFLGRRMLFDAVRILGPARASVFHSSAPAFAFIGAWLFAGEIVTLRDLALVALVWAGLGLTHPPAGTRPGDTQLTPELRRRGFLVGVGAVAGFGFGNVLRGLAVRAWDEVLFGTALSAVAALALQLAVLRNWRKVFADLRGASRTGLALYAGCGIATSLGSVFVTMAMKNVQIGVAVLVVHTTPLVIFPVSVFLLKRREELTARTLAGTALVLAGIAALLLG
jgi:drug/metabolite transporter (DMT)-like permease